MNAKYEKIINLPHHVSATRQSMPQADRAAQFAPYSALSGYEDAVEETARFTDKKIELDEYEKERINSTLFALLSSPTGTRLTLTYFRPDKNKSGGEYITLNGEFSHIDEAKKEITVIGRKPIKIDSIIEAKIVKNEQNSHF